MVLRTLELIRVNEHRVGCVRTWDPVEAIVTKSLSGAWSVWHFVRSSEPQKYTCGECPVINLAEPGIFVGQSGRRVHHLVC